MTQRKGHPRNEPERRRHLRAQILILAQKVIPSLILPQTRIRVLTLRDLEHTTISDVDQQDAPSDLCRVAQTHEGADLKEILSRTSFLCGIISHLLHRGPVKSETLYIRVYTSKFQQTFTLMAFVFMIRATMSP